jgi:hypothetical protein
MWPPLCSGREPSHGKILEPPLTIMAFSIEDLGDIDLTIGQWCLDKVPPEHKKQIDYDYEVDGQSVTIFEVRPLWRGQAGQTTRRPVVKFRYVKSSELWRIYWMRQNGKWESYEPASAACRLEEALDIIELDNYGCFFG